MNIIIKMLINYYAAKGNDRKSRPKRFQLRICKYWAKVRKLCSERNFWHHAYKAGSYLHLSSGYIPVLTWCRSLWESLWVSPETNGIGFHRVQIHPKVAPSFNQKLAQSDVIFLLLEDDLTHLIVIGRITLAHQNYGSDSFEQNANSIWLNVIGVTRVQLKLSWSQLWSIWCA